MIYIFLGFGLFVKSFGLTYPDGVQPRATAQRGMMGWLFCALLLCYALLPSGCPACDALAAFQRSTNHAVELHRVNPVDTCDGACSCCLLQVEPVSIAVGTQEPVLTSHLIVHVDDRELDRPLSIFRPPRSSTV